MPFPLTGYRVFIASPAGLQPERQLFRQTLERYNDEIAIMRGAMFMPVGWEDTLAGVGRPQELINEDLKKCDYFGTGGARQRRPDRTRSTHQGRRRSSSLR